MKIFFQSRQAARDLNAKTSNPSRVVDSKDAPSANQSRWAVEIKRVVK